MFSSLLFQKQAILASMTNSHWDYVLRMRKAFPKPKNIAKSSWALFTITFPNGVSLARQPRKGEVRKTISRVWDDEIKPNDQPRCFRINHHTRLKTDFRLHSSSSPRTDLIRIFSSGDTFTSLLGCFKIISFQRSFTWDILSDLLTMDGEMFVTPEKL